MSVSNDELDLAILSHAVDQYASELPIEVAEQLLQGVKAIQHQEPQAVPNLVGQLRHHAALDDIYGKALRNLRQGYTTQERAKSIVLTAEQPLSQPVKTAIADLVTQLEAILVRQHSRAGGGAAVNGAQAEILKALEKTPLRSQDLAYTIGRPLEQLQPVVQVLWQDGYIDQLSASPLYTLFPGLRTTQYRHRPVSSTTFLTLTSKGYFHLYPLRKKPEMETR